MNWNEIRVEDVAAQMARARVREGVFERLNDADQWEAWPVLRLDRLAVKALRHEALLGEHWRRSRAAE